MVDHCSCDRKAQRPANERQWLWPRSHHHSLRSWMKTGVLLGLGFHLKREFKGIFMTAIFIWVGEGRKISGGREKTAVPHVSGVNQPVIEEACLG